MTAAHRLTGGVTIERTGQGFFEAVPDTERVAFETAWADVLAVVSNATDITDSNSLENRLSDIDAEIENTQGQVAAILNGSIRFSEIFLPISFQLSEGQIFFDGVLGHNHTGGSLGKKISHSNITDITPNDHHLQIHAINGPDHSGSLSELDLRWSPAGHSHDGFTARISHANVTDIEPDTHHPMLHSYDSHSGDISGDSVLFDGIQLRLILDGIREQLTIHEDTAWAHGSPVESNDLAIHMTDSSHTQAMIAVAGVYTLNGLVSEIQIEQQYIEDTISELIARVDTVESDLFLKANLNLISAMIKSYGGSLGMISPITDGAFTNLTADSLIASSFETDSMELIDLTVTGNFILDAAGSISLPDSAVAQVSVGSVTPLYAWAETPVTLVDDLDNIRYMLTKVSGEPWGMDGDIIPEFTPTSAFGGQDLKTFEETAWYYDWLVAHEICRGMFFDTFADDSGATLINNPTNLYNNMLIGPAVYTSIQADYDGDLYDIMFVIVHIESSDPSKVSCRITANNGTSWTSISHTRFDVPVTLLPGAYGRAFQIEITLTSGVELYSYGVLLGTGLV